MNSSPPKQPSQRHFKSDHPSEHSVLERRGPDLIKEIYAALVLKHSD